MNEEEDLEKKERLDRLKHIMKSKLHPNMDYPNPMSCNLNPIITYLLEVMLDELDARDEITVLLESRVKALEKRMRSTEIELNSKG
jgi:hypothetical protein